MKNFKLLSLYSFLYILTGIVCYKNVFIPTDGYFSLWVAGGFGFIMLARYGKTALPYLVFSNLILQFLLFQIYNPQPVNYVFSSAILLSSIIKTTQPLMAWVIWEKLEQKKGRPLFRQGFDVFQFLLYIAIVPSLLTSWGFVVLNELYQGTVIVENSEVLYNILRISAADAMGLFLFGPLIYSINSLKLYSPKELMILVGSYLIPFVAAKAINNNFLFVIVTPAAIISAYYIDIKKLIPFHLIVLILVMWLSTHQMTVFSNEMADKGFMIFMVFAFIATITLFYTSISFTELKEHKNNLEKIVSERTIDLENEIKIRKKTENELKNKDRLVNTILSSSPIGITLIKGRRVVWVNEAATAILGYDAVEIIYQDTLKYYSDEKEYQKIGSELYPKLLQKGFGSIETKLKNKEGKILEVLLQAVPLNKDDLADGLIFAIVDITTLKCAERELKERSVKLEEINRELDAFAHSVAHDLKNPLNAIMGFSELLVNEDYIFDDDEKTEYLRRINMQSEKMLQIIDTLLLLSGVRKEKVKMEYCRMKDVVNRSVSGLDEIITTEKAKINIPEIMPVLKSHSPWLEVVWVNLISNAIKYGGKPAEIKIGYRETESHMHFWVDDNGFGIPEDKKDTLFKEYVRIKYDKNGHGLGLSIVKRIIERLNGDVFVESKPGFGSRFGFTLPKVNIEVSPLSVEINS
ncbi:ATP-binding protein [Saccharicrinis sp. FJH2]|uniref:ATP-binding protein n=1 Tax=Saccharicrinis sp. FJH65 TaxID=3344659 RepID=UPI0035F49FD7